MIGSEIIGSQTVGSHHRSNIQSKENAFNGCRHLHHYLHYYMRRYLRRYLRRNLHRDVRRDTYIYYMLSAFLLLFLLSTGVTKAASLPPESGQDGDPINIGERVTLESKILNETRSLLVYLPPNYDQTSERYPVLTVLDGGSLFYLTVGILHQLNAYGQAPPMIVVGVLNVDRNRDFLPTNMPHVPTSGGGNRFQEFMANELLPYIDNRYRTHPYRIFVGHSFGGFCVVYTLFNNPQLFNAYIAVSPSLHWDNGLVIKKAAKVLERKVTLNKFLYMTMGDEGKFMLQSIGDFSKLLKNRPLSGIDWHYYFLKEENHISTPHRTIYGGLKTLYAQWPLPRKLAGQHLKGLRKHYQHLSKKFGYKIIIPEFTLNTLGYALLTNRKGPEALEAFKLNVELHPESPNVYDSLGEAYEALKDYPKAIEYYKIALEKAAKMNLNTTAVFRQHLERVEQKQDNSLNK